MESWPTYLNQKYYVKAFDEWKQNHKIELVASQRKTIIKSIEDALKPEDGSKPKPHCAFRFHYELSEDDRKILLNELFDRHFSIYCDGTIVPTGLTNPKDYPSFGYYVIKFYD